MAIEVAMLNPNDAARNCPRHIRQDSRCRHHKQSVTNSLSVSEHVRGVVRSSAQTLYAIRALRAHGMCKTALHAIFRSAMVAKLLYASSAWYGLHKVTDRQRVDAFLLRSKWCGYCPMDLPSFEELCKTSDDQLFNKVINDQHHLLFNLRRRTHDKQLPKHTGHLTDSNFTFIDTLTTIKLDLYMII